MIKPFLFWKQELEKDVDHGLIEVDCSKRYKQKFVDAIISMLTDMDKFFVENDLYKYNDYYKFADKEFMNIFGYKPLYPKFIQDNSLSKEAVAGRCAFDEDYYNTIRISREDLFNKSTLCHEFLHFLTLNNFYYNHPRDERFKVFVNSPKRGHHTMLKRQHKTVDVQLGESVMQDNEFFYEGLTEFLSSEIYPETKGKVYAARVKMFEILAGIIGKHNIMRDFVQGNISSIEKYFDAKTWERKYIGNFADFLKYTEGFIDDVERGKSYYLFRELNANYKGAIKCLMKAYYQNLLHDEKNHSVDEFMKLFEFCVDYGAFAECKDILKQIVKFGKISGLESQISKMNKMGRAFERDYSDWQCKVGDFLLEAKYGNDCINFVVNLGKNNKLNLKFDGVDGFEADGGYERRKKRENPKENKSGVKEDKAGLASHKFNKHSKEYLQFKARGTEFSDGRKATEMSIDIESNFIKIEFFDRFGEKIHAFGINYGHTKNAMFDDKIYNFDPYENHTK
ncbi:MAG: hypothetical protein J6T39_00885, partial [Clostridia bacterium]|nr:hypothetical protein [Clostridia bacterium]